MTKKNLATIRGNLRKTKNTIKRLGWVKHTMRDEATGAVCTLGAFETIGIWENCGDPTLFIFQKAISRHLKKGNVPVDHWNDSRQRTLDQVYDMFDYAIELAKEPSNFKKLEADTYEW